jgi:ribonuclease-3 family protein
MHEPLRQTDLPSVAALAYLGDAVYSYRIRRMLVQRGISRAAELNRRSLDYVTAEAQSALYLRIEPHRAEDERDVARRAMNSGHLSRPKHASAADYRRATALEAVFGMLDHLGDTERIGELLSLGGIDPDPDGEG